MTWLEFKTAAEREGIKDGDTVETIEYEDTEGWSMDVSVSRAEDAETDGKFWVSIEGVIDGPDDDTPEP